VGWRRELLRGACKSAPPSRDFGGKVGRWPDCHPLA
jgi:hypothetical protein